MAKLKKLLTPRVTMGLFLLALLLLLLSSASGTRAALTYFSDDYTAEVDMDHIGVSLLENGEIVSHRNYLTGSGKWDGDGSGVLLEALSASKEELKPGVAYPEAIAARNTGTIPQYVRLTLYKYWVNADGSKNRKLAPELIELHEVEDSGWQRATDPGSNTRERTVYYYPGILNPGDETPAVTDTLTVNVKAQATVTQTVEDGKIVTTYTYDDMQFVIEAQVDAVQDRHFDDAAVSTWGRNGPNG